MLKQLLLIPILCVWAVINVCALTSGKVPPGGLHGEIPPNLQLFKNTPGLKPLKQVPEAIVSEQSGRSAPGFIENKGQLTDLNGNSNTGIRYLLTMPGLNVQLRQNGFSYDTYAEHQQEGKQVRKFHRVDIDLVGINKHPHIVTAGRQQEVQTVVNGQGTFTGIRRYEKVTYQNIYPGIDIEFVARPGNDKPVEYNFILHPGADPSQIHLLYKGANSTALQGEKILVKVAHGDLSEHIPASWTTTDGKRLAVQYKQTGPDQYAFDVPAYDRTQTLIIDPAPDVTWATYLGGSNSDVITATTSDPAGNIYVTGHTSSTGGIATAGAFQGTYGGGVHDIFISKFSPDGERLWSTYYGGTGADEAYAIKWSNGQLLIGGQTNSNGLSTTGVFKEARNNQAEALVASFDPNTGTRNWSTYYGGREAFINSIDTDAEGNVFVLGATGLAVFPLSQCAPGDFSTPGTYMNSGGGCGSVFLTKFSPDGSSRIWGTIVLYGPGKKAISNGGGLTIATDNAGDVYVAGAVASGANLTEDAGFASNVGEGTTPSFGFLARFSGNAGTKDWGRFYSGQISDFIINEAENQIITVGSHTHSSSSSTGFVTSFALNGQEQYTRTVGTQGKKTYVTNISVTPNGQLAIAGQSNTSSNELADNCSAQPNPSGESDAFLNGIDPATGERLWGTYYGGSGDDIVTIGVTGSSFNNYPTSSRTLTVLPDGNIVLGINSQSTGLATSGAHSNVFAGTQGGLLVRFNDGSLPEGYAISSSSISPLSQTACILGIPAVINGNAVSFTAPAGFNRSVSYQWQKSESPGGPWTDMSGETYKNLQPEASQATLYYRRQIKYCDAEVIGISEVATVEISSNVSPTANADGPQWFVCGPGSNTVELNGSATGGAPAYSYQWFEGSIDTAPVSTSSIWTTQGVTQATTYTLKVTDAAGCIDFDQVTIVPAVANAGPDQSVCQGESGIKIGSPPVADPNVSYQWTVVSGTAGSLSCISCAQPVADPLEPTTYQLTVTVQQKGGGQCTTTSNVTITPVQAPDNDLNFAGPDHTICKNNAVTLGGTTDDSYAYTWTSGQFLSNSQITSPVFNAGTAAVPGGAVNYTVTAIKEGCAFVDKVKVSVINSRITHQDELKQGPVWSTHLDEDNAPGTTYSWSIVSGDGEILKTESNNKNAYLKSNSGVTTFRRTVTLNGISCTADIMVEPYIPGGSGICDFDIVTVSEQGCPKVFGATALRLGTNFSDAANYNFSWSPANLVDNPNAPVVTITSTNQATITVTVTSKYDPSISCSESIVINPPGASLPVFTAEDVYTCPGIAVQIGNTGNAGFSYQWKLSADRTAEAYLNDVTLSNPMATVNATTNFFLTVTEDSWGCETRDIVTVYVSDIVADAGPDRAICNGATVTLGTPAPAGTNWVYSWEPANASWASGSLPSDAQPQVLFAGTSQTFTVTVTDPLSGCSATDQVTLSNTIINSGDYSGEDQIICEGETVTIGADSKPEATYQWLMTGVPIAGQTNSTLEVTPETTTIYTVRVTYPGCTTPMEENITVTVNPKPADTELMDREVCKGTVIEIGFGAPGNPAAPAGVTAYRWSPSAGLSATNVANPQVTVNARTEYTVIFTLSSGCQFEEKVVVNPTIDAGNDVSVCLGESIVIGKAAISGYDYAWTGDGIVSGANTAQPTILPTSTTTYNLTVTQGGVPVCTDQVVATVNQPVSFDISGNTTLCEGGNTTLSLVGAPAANTSWQWSPVNGVANPNATSTLVTPATAGTRTYRLTQINQTTGCTNYREVVVVTRTNTITATTGNLAICEDETSVLPLSVTSAGDYSYVWSPSTGLSNAFVANPSVTAGTPGTYTVTITDNLSQCQLIRQVNVSINTPQACLPPVSLSGNVFHDGNGLCKDAEVNNSSATPIPAGLYVTLTDADNTAVRTVPVNPDGTYDFGITAPGNYSIVLHEGSAGSIVPGLPSGWVNTGENLGTGTGSDRAVDGILTDVTVYDENVTNANFGIQQPPVADTKEYVIDQPLVDDEILLDGTHVSTGPGTSSPDDLTGFDTEDGTLDGSAVIITALPGNGELYYNGVLVYAGQTIPNYDPALMTLKLTGTGYTNVTFEYAYVDNGCVQSLPATYTIRWGSPLPVTLVSFQVASYEHTAELTWVTTEETNSERFEIHHSTDGKKWNIIGSVKAEGESKIGKTYSFTDNTPHSGENLYRLKMIDRDNSYAFSMIKSLLFDNASESIIYPNPVTDLLHLKVSNRTKVKSVRIDNLAGIQVYSSATVDSGGIDVSNLSAGIYILRITHLDGSVHIHKFVHVK